ncbi:MAG: hypothetical protein R3255_09590 [Candidatus Lokiarchaeia archaeon]|nr:hypothetical protein [Candidatus Lokiarchaeia archaeon]
MSDDIDLKSLEKKAYRSLFDDGLWDLFIGMTILGMGISTSLGSLFNLPDIWITFIPIVIWYTITFLIFYLGKKFISIPRIGLVKFGPKRKSKHLKLKLFLSAFLILNIVLFILPFTGLISSIPLEPLFMALLLGLGSFTFPFCVVAFFLDFTRLYFYAFLAGIGLFLTVLINPIVGSPMDALLIFGSIGGLIVVIGFYYFIRFLKKYPLSNKVSNNGKKESRIR